MTRKLLSGFRLAVGAGAGKLLGSDANGDAAWENPPLKDLIFGDASDGSATLDGTTDYASWSTRSGSVYTMTRDVFLSSLTINSTRTLEPNGYRVYVSGTLTNNGTIRANGPNAGGGTGGAGYAVGSLAAQCKGGDGTTGAGIAGQTIDRGLGSAGGTGGAGGGGAGGAGGTASAVATNIRAIITFLLMRTLDTDALITAGGGGGGGGGGTGGVGVGGGGGCAGGLVYLICKTLAGNGTITANGGNGDSSGGVGVNKGGGGGGGAGVIIIGCRTDSSTVTYATNGGTGGAGTGTGAAGSNGTTPGSPNKFLYTI